MTATLKHGEKRSRKTVTKKIGSKLTKAKEKAKIKLTRIRLDLKVKICPKCGNHSYVIGRCVSCKFKSRRRVKIEKMLEATFNKELSNLNE